MIFRRFSFLFIIVNLVWASISYSQDRPLSTDNPKAKKLFFSAFERYQANDLQGAHAELKKAITADPGFTEALILQGDIYSEEKQPDKAIESYQGAINANKPFAPALYTILANIQLNQGLYKDAQSNFLRFLESGDPSEKRKTQAEQGLQACSFALRQIANPVPFAPVNMGDSINSRFDDYVNAITADEATLYLTRKKMNTSGPFDQNQDFEEDFYLSSRHGAIWAMAKPLGAPVNTFGNEGALTISPDGQYLFFAACGRDDGYGSCDLYWAKRTNDRWSLPQNLGPVVNSPQWDSQPTFSSDGKTLCFASKRPGGKGSSDIWKSMLQADGQWGIPLNVGGSINTPAEEMSPFIHPDGQTFYFSSKGHPGMGGLDLFYARKTEDGNWDEPVNLGFPINTHANEISFIVNARGDLGYISSDLPGGEGGHDIYEFPLYPEAQPVLTSYLKGVVFDRASGEKLDAKFELIDIGTSDTWVESISNPVTGEFLLVLPSGKNFALNVSKEGYLFFSENISLMGEHSSLKPRVMNIPLKKIQLGESVVLKNIFFDTGHYILKEESTTELNKLIEYLKKNSGLKIEISGHTDSVGTLQYNQELSENRAKAVYEYLIRSGIGPERLTFKGYGPTKPVGPNDTEQGRANNRRTEFKITGN